MTSAVLKNGGLMAQKFGSVAFLYCACSIITEKSRGVEDDLNTLIGGAAAGTLYALPGKCLCVFNILVHDICSTLIEFCMCVFLLYYYILFMCCAVPPAAINFQKHGLQQAEEEAVGFMRRNIRYIVFVSTFFLF